MKAARPFLSCDSMTLALNWNRLSRKWLDAGEGSAAGSTLPLWTIQHSVFEWWSVAKGRTSQWRETQAHGLDSSSAVGSCLHHLDSHVYKILFVWCKYQNPPVWPTAPVLLSCKANLDGTVSMGTPAPHLTDSSLWLTLTTQLCWSLTLLQLNPVWKASDSTCEADTELVVRLQVFCGFLWAADTFYSSGMIWSLTVACVTGIDTPHL